MKNRIVLIGAGSAMFGLETLGDIFRSKALTGSEVVLHDINPESLRQVEGMARQYVQEHRLPYTLSATTSRREALQGASFCIISIEVGDRYVLWEQDWKIPLQHGIRQVYGENGGPGGLFHSLRIIPPILEICGDICSICPEAYVLNLSNPLTRICQAVKRKYPDLKLIGLCHEVASLPMLLPLLLETPLSNLSFRAAGLNHFSFLLEVTYKDSGKDAYPDVRQRAPKFFADMPERGLFRELLKRFGYLPVTTDSHFGEYIPWAHDVVDHKAILNFYAVYKAWGLTQDPHSRIQGTSEWEHMRVVPIIEGILTDSGHEELAVDVANDGLIHNLPPGLVVEVPAVVDREGVHGVKVGALPRGIAGLLNNQVAAIDLTVEAALTGSRDIALQALLVDPVVHSVRAAEQTLDTMLELQQRYLGYIK